MVGIDIQQGDSVGVVFFFTEDGSSTPVPVHGKQVYLGVESDSRSIRVFWSEDGGVVFDGNRCGCLIPSDVTSRLCGEYCIRVGYSENGCRATTDDYAVLNVSKNLTGGKRV